jgi:RND superfamily putative drug exporter
VPTVGFILLAGSPFLQFRLQNADATTIPPQVESRRGYDLLVSSFPGQEQSTITAVVYFPGGAPDSAPHADYIRAITADIKGLPNVLSVSAPRYTGRIAALSVVTSRPASTDDARDLVKAIRGLFDPIDGELLVTGTTAFDVDTVDFIISRSVRAVPFVVLMTYIALFFLLGSVLLPLKAVVMNLLSITASFGALVFVFEQGHFADLLNFTPQSVDPAVPVILFCIVFGLSMDYEVLLLSRIQEEYERTGDNTLAVAEGLERIGRLITAAALIMVAVFTGFALADIVIIKSIGVGMAIAVALDATIVRALIVPATMRLLGRANWWAPAFMLRIQRRLLPLRRA